MKTSAQDFKDAIVSFNLNVATNNQKKVAKLVALLNDKTVVAMLNAQNVEAHDLNIALYSAEKAIKFVYAVTRKDCNASDFEVNTTSAIKSLLNAQAIDETVTRADIHDMIMIDAKTSRDHIYARKNKIDSKAQVDYTFAALQLLKVIDRASNKAIDCELMTVAKVALKDVVI